MSLYGSILGDGETDANVDANQTPNVSSHILCASNPFQTTLVKHSSDLYSFSCPSELWPSPLCDHGQDQCPQLYQAIHSLKPPSFHLSRRPLHQHLSCWERASCNISDKRSLLPRSRSSSRRTFQNATLCGYFQVQSLPSPLDTHQPCFPECS